MIQVVFHALGGQGAKSAAHVLALAAFSEGKDIQAYPEFGPERRGTPVRAFVRISESRITTHEPVTVPDYSVIIDPSLITADRMNGVCVVNSQESAEEIRKKTGFKGQLHVLDALKVSPYANLPMLAAFVKVSNVVRIGSVIRHAEELFGEKAKQSIEAVRLAEGMVR